jgi:AcrR family transcriptional regulator
MAEKLNRKARKAATRRAVKEAALGCFAESGYAETSIAAITRAAGVAQGTFYVHFPSKDALLDELLDEFNQEFVARLAPIWIETAATRLEELVTRSAEAFLEHWETRKDFVEIYAQKTAQGMSLAELTEGINPPVVELLTPQLAGMAREAGTALPNAQLIVQALLAMWARIGLQYLFNPNVNRRQAVRTLRQMTMGALEKVVGASDRRKKR